MTAQFLAAFVACGFTRGDEDLQFRSGGFGHGWLAAMMALNSCSREWNVSHWPSVTKYPDRIQSLAIHLLKPSRSQRDGAGGGGKGKAKPRSAWRKIHNSRADPGDSRSAPEIGTAATSTRWPTGEESGSVGQGVDLAGSGKIRTSCVDVWRARFHAGREWIRKHGPDGTGPSRGDEP